MMSTEQTIQLSQQLSEQFSERLQTEVLLSIAIKPIDSKTLPKSEQDVIEQTTHVNAKNSRLMARQALKNVFNQLGMSYQHLTFPHPQFSIAHSHDAGVAIALNINNNDQTKSKQTKSVGIDLEPLRLVKESGWKFFLSEDEREYIKGLNELEQEKELIRLWTVKEALFKATPENKEKNLVVSYFKTDEPSVLSGQAYLKDSDACYEYFSHFNETLGWLTVAICL